MPRTEPNPREILLDHLQQQAAKVAALSQRQTWTVVDSSQATTSAGVTTPGPAILDVGQIPNGQPTATPRWESPSRPLYGVQVRNRTTGNPVTHYGSQPDGSHGLWSLDDNGDPVLKVGEIKIGASTYYALAAYDPSGDLRVLVGQLESGDYGLSVQDTQSPTPVVREILPLYSQFENTTVSTASASYVSLTGAPTVTAILGASGDAQVAIAALIGPSASNATGLVTLEVDGSTDAGGWLEVSSSGDPIACSASTIRQLSQTDIGALSSGSHSFALKFRSSSGTVNFSAMCLSVQPI